MADPAKRIARDLPVLTFTTWDTVGVVRQALDALEQGMFLAPAQLAEFMTRDDRIAGVLATRVQALLGLPFRITGENDDDPVAETATKLWPQMFPESSLAQLLRWGLLLGVGLGQLLWKREAKQITPRLKVWHPQFITWRWDTRSYWVSTMDGQVEVVPGDGQWVLYTPYGYERGWMGAQIRALAIPWLARQFSMRDWARYSEVHGLPIRAGVVPEQGKEEDKERFISELAQLSTESIIRLPQDSSPAGAKFDVKLIEATADTYQGFQKFIEQCNSAIAITLLGQNLSTEVKSGSLAAARVHERVRQDVLEWDEKTLSACLDDQALSLWQRANYGDAEPLECGWETDPPEDLVAKSTATQTLSVAMVNFKTAMVPVDVEKVAEEYGVPLLEGSDAPDFSDPPDPPAPAAEPDEEGAPPVPGQKQQAARVQADRLPRPLVDGQLYVDALADGELPAAAAALKPDLNELLKVVKGRSYEEIRSHLRSSYRQMNPTALAELLEKALILADLAGRHAALEAL